MKKVKLLSLLLTVVMLLSVFAGCTQNDTPVETNAETTPKTIAETLPDTEADTEVQTEQQTEAETSGIDITQAEWYPLVDFVVEAETGRDIRVLQLTDTQIIDASQQRSATRLNETSQVFWGRDRLEQNYKNYVREVIAETQPDFIFITGDVVYGEFDDDGSILLDFIDFMESFGIPWSPVFGNHDNETKKGVDWQCEQYVNAEHCLFKQRDLTGNSNYTVGLVQGGKLERVFFMMDSNGCGAISSQSLANGHSTANAGFGSDQIRWFRQAAADIITASPATKLSFAFHIQLSIFTQAFAKYGFTNSGTESNPINIDTAANKEDTDFGYLGRDLKSPWDNGSVWNAIKATGADSVFVGHEHCNSGSVIYEGIRLQYGQKSSTYDRYNVVQEDGSIAGGYILYGTPIVGGTLMSIAEGTGEIINPHIVLATGEEYKKPDAPAARYTYTFDFNGTDVDSTVTTQQLSKEVCCAATDTAPEGFTGGVYSAQSAYLVCIGVKFPTEIDYDTLASMKIRMYVQENSASSKPTLFRLYDAKTNSIRSDNKYSVLGGKPGEWCEIEVADLLQSATLVKNGKVQPFTIVYRCYDADSIIWFDSITVQTSVELK